VSTTTTGIEQLKRDLIAALRQAEADGAPQIRGHLYDAETEGSCAMGVFYAWLLGYPTNSYEEGEAAIMHHYGMSRDEAIDQSGFMYHVVQLNDGWDGYAKHTFGQIADQLEQES
jgi:hypothetical protein